MSGRIPAGLFRLPLAAVVVVWGALAQDAPQPAPAPATSRAAEIEQQRQKKARELHPDVLSSAERVLDYIEDHKIVDRLTGGEAGFRIKLGGLITGSGFAVGPEYYRRDLLRERLRFRASARASTKKFSLIDAELDAPRLAGNHVFANLYAVHRDYPRIDYYGPGPDSAKTGRSDFKLEDTSFQFRGGVQPFQHLRIGATGRYLLVNIGPGRDERFVSTDQIFTEATTPGIQNQTNFLQGGAYVQFDWRDYPGEPRRGGNYIAEYSSYSDIDRGAFSFSRLDLEVQQYFSIFNQRRVLALRGRVQATDPHAGQQVPFYLQPTLGGSDDLRGFRPFRFYDNNSVVLNGEYRWEVFSGLDMALFADAGRVFHDWHQINVRELETDYGFGFRFNVRNNVFMRIDTGFSREGFQLWLKFNNVF